VFTGGVYCACACECRHAHAHGLCQKNIVVQCFFPTQAEDTDSVYCTPMYTACVGVRLTIQNIPEIFRSTGSGRRDIIH